MTNEIQTSIAVIQKDASTFLEIGNNLIAKSKALVIVKTEDTQIARSLLKDCQKAEKELEEKRIEIVRPLNDFVSEVNTLFKETKLPILTAKNGIQEKIVKHTQEQERIRKEEEAKRFAEEQARLKKLEEERLERERIEAQKRAEEQAKLREEQERLRKLEEERIAKEIEAKKANEEAQRKIREEAEKQRLEREKIENERLEIERQKREAAEERRRLEEEKRIMEEKRIAEEAEKKKAEEMRIKGIVKKWAWEIVDEQKIPRAFCSSDSKKINEAIKSGIREIDGIRIFESTTVR